PERAGCTRGPSPIRASIRRSRRRTSSPSWNSTKARGWSAISTTSIRATSPSTCLSWSQSSRSTSPSGSLLFGPADSPRRAAGTPQSDSQRCRHLRERKDPLGSCRLKDEVAMDGRRARALLGVAEDATPEDLRRAFRTRALATHPDRGGDRTAFELLVL